MSLASDLTELACELAVDHYSESIVYSWDQLITGTGQYVGLAYWQYTTTSDSGVLQTAPESAGPWTDLVELSPGRFTASGNAWVRTSEENGETNWNIELSIAAAVRTRGNWRTDEPAAKQVAVSERIQHWIVSLQDLQHPNGDRYHEPQREDTIETDDGEIFRVMPQSKDGPLWRWVNEHGKTHRRIFSRERSTS